MPEGDSEMEELQIKTVSTDSTIPATAAALPKFKLMMLGTIHGLRDSLFVESILDWDLWYLLQIPWFFIIHHIITSAPISSWASWPIDQIRFGSTETMQCSEIGKIFLSHPLVKACIMLDSHKKSGLNCRADRKSQVRHCLGYCSLIHRPTRTKNQQYKNPNIA